MKSDLSFPVEKLCQLVEYDPSTGVLYWKARPPHLFNCKESSRRRVANCWNRKYAGCPIESRMADGRIIVHFNLGMRFRTQGARVAWAIHHGRWPAGMVDHIDGDCTNDRISNLRDVSASENCRNQRISKRNTSGKVGVTFNKRAGKWRAWINIDGKAHALGYFNNIDDAVSARIEAENHHGFFEALRRSERSIK